MKKSGFLILFLVAFVFTARAESRGYSEWVKRREALKQDKSVIRYYTFENVKDSKSVVDDLSGSGGDLTFTPFKDVKTGEVFNDLKVIEGRWPEKRAASLNRGWYQGAPVHIENKSFTVEVWFRKNGPGAISITPGQRDGYIVSSPPGWGSGWRIQTAYTPSPFLTFDIGTHRDNVRGSVRAKNNTLFPDNVWLHVAGTWNGREMKLYVNGDLAASQEYTGEYIPNGNPFRIGFRDGGSVLLDMDEVVIYNRVLSEKEINAAYTRAAGWLSRYQQTFHHAALKREQGDYREALESFEKSLQLASTDRERAEAFLKMGEIKEKQGDYRSAIEDFNSALQLGITEMEKAEILLKTAEIKEKQGDYRSAIEDFRSVLELEVTERQKAAVLSKISELELDEIFNRADRYIKAGDYQGARAEYGKLKHLPDYGRELAFFNMAESCRLEKDYSNVHRIFSEIYAIPGITPFYRIYGLFKEADVYLEQKDYRSARKLYEKIAGVEGASEHHIFKARLAAGDTYRAENIYSRAKIIYEELLIKEESSVFPNDGYRLDIRDRLESIDGLADGEKERSRNEKLIDWVNLPKHSIYVSSRGRDDNTGTIDAPFATIQRAREEVRRINKKGLPPGGISVLLREGIYFLTESLVFGMEDSGREDSPVVYRSYPGEDVRIIGGRQVDNFELLADPGILRRLPESSRGRVWTADLKEAGITGYGTLLNRGFGRARPGALELICNGKIMELGRWPDKGWTNIAGLTQVDGEFRGTKYQKGKFMYSGNRPERWVEEKDMWIKGYIGVNQPYALIHMKIDKIDTEEKTISLLPNTLPGAHPRWIEGPAAKGHPYYVYNLLSEIEKPGEWYLDRETGKIYFYPPCDIKNSEVIATTLENPVVILANASNIALLELTIEGTWSHGVEIKGGSNNLVAGSVIRNTGQWGVIIENGWNHKVVGCDIHDTGEGGVSLDFEQNTSRLIRGRRKLIPSGHLVENNHIYRFNRFCGGYRQGVRIDGVGQRVSRNLIHDSPHQLIYFNANDHIIEFNEIHDGPHEGREIGAMYIYGEPWYLMSRGTVIRNNFFHHISSSASPNISHGLNAIHIDAMNGGLVLDKNIFYRFPQGISSTQPGNLLTNNLFIDGDGYGISQGDRSRVFCNGHSIEGGPNFIMMEGMSARLNSVRHKQPPWSYRYPMLTGMMEKDPATWGQIQGSIIRRNVNTGGRFFSIASGLAEHTVFENNWTGQHLLFMDKEKLDFRLRPGSPVFGITGCDPVSMENIGVYKDGLRASWPIDRKESDIGKYWNRKVESKLARVSPQLLYEIGSRKSPVTIDGRLEKDEWLQLDKNRAMVIKKYYTGEDKSGPETHVWMLHDNRYLYVATRHEADPCKEGMDARAKDRLPVFELAIESQEGPHSRGWWMEDMQTGPIYVIWGTFNGEALVQNIFGMLLGDLMKIQKSIEYKNLVLDKENLTWTSEMKIPLEKIGINPGEAGQLAFNIGVHKRDGWYAWVPTGGSIFKLENAGLVSFSSE
ncbi:MAG TPA: right-handed parallel beta-helix repeat-containing protein [bacterium]|nr:right-handed parallel beta-helix repeat-containing protein [bacterium]